ncbi:unnamed protein product, partial [Larinioides sclopetarius]
AELLLSRLKKPGSKQEYPADVTCHFASIDKNGMKMSFRSQTLVLINAK